MRSEGREEVETAPVDEFARRDLLELVDVRYRKRSTLVAAQGPVDQWHEVIGDPAVADAILDRPVHNAHKIQMQGESMRKLRGGLTTEPTVRP